MAAASSALVGSFIGDLTGVDAGDDVVDCRPQEADTFLTEKLDFSGEGSSFFGEVPPLGGEISCKALDTGLLGEVG